MAKKNIFQTPAEQRYQEARKLLFDRFIKQKEMIEAGATFDELYPEPTPQKFNIELPDGNINSEVLANCKINEFLQNEHASIEQQQLELEYHSRTFEAEKTDDVRNIQDSPISLEDCSPDYTIESLGFEDLYEEYLKTKH